MGIISESRYRNLLVVVLGLFLPSMRRRASTLTLTFVQISWAFSFLESLGVVGCNNLGFIGRTRVFYIGKPFPSQKPILAAPRKARLLDEGHVQRENSQ